MFKQLRQTIEASSDEIIFLFINLTKKNVLNVLGYFFLNKNVLIYIEINIYSNKTVISYTSIHANA